MKIQRISRLLCLALGLTVFELSTNMAPAQSINPVVSAIQITSTMSKVGTNGSPYQSKMVYDQTSTLNWTLGQPSSASSSYSGLGYSWSFPPGGWNPNITNVSHSITDWPQGDTGTMTTVSFHSSPMPYGNGTFTSTGPAAAYVPPTNNWQYAFGDVQVAHFSTTDTNTTTLDANAVLQLKTNGGTNYGPSSIFKITVSASERCTILITNGFYPYYYTITTNIGSRPIPPGNINCGLGTFGANGVLYTNLSNNASYTVTPTLPAQYTNYIFNLSAQRIPITITMRTINQITPYTTNVTLNGMVGPIYYDALTNWFGQTNLGVGPTTQAGSSKSISNLAEFTAGVPDDPIFNSGWVWHRDGDGIEYSWTGGTNVNWLDWRFPALGQAPPDDGSDDPAATQGNIFFTVSPDAARVLFEHDAPRIKTAGDALPIYASAPAGSVFAKRFNARQWLTWNGSLVSNIVLWHTQVTVKKTSDSAQPWIRVGPNNEIGEGHLPSIDFTPAEASQY